MHVLQSTYCAHIQQHAADEKRTIEVVNLDPAAENFEYQPLVDIRELIHVDDAMDDEELHYGPNGALVFCIEYAFRSFFTYAFLLIGISSAGI